MAIIQRYHRRPQNCNSFIRFNVILEKFNQSIVFVGDYIFRHDDSDFHKESLRCLGFCCHSQP